MVKEIKTISFISINLVIRFIDIKEDCFCFLLSLEFIKNFCIYFLYCVYFTSLFTKPDLSFIYFLLLFQVSDKFLIFHPFECFAKYICFGSFPSFSKGIIVVYFQVFGISPSSTSVSGGSLFIIWG